MRGCVGRGFPLARELCGSQVEISKVGLPSRRKATSHREDARKCLHLPSGYFNHNLINTGNQSRTFSLNNLPLQRTGPCLEIIIPCLLSPCKVLGICHVLSVQYVMLVPTVTHGSPYFTHVETKFLEGLCDLFNTHTAGFSETWNSDSERHLASSTPLCRRLCSSLFLAVSAWEV